MTRHLRSLFCFTFLFFCVCSNAFGQALTWDPDADQVNNGGAGTWDTSSLNWDDNGAAPNVAWTNGNDAIFGSGTYQVDLTPAGVTVGDVTYGGGGTLEFRGSTASGSPGDAITINPGGATWDTGGGEIEFFNDGNNSNTRLSMTSGDTLTVQGGGTFDTGQNPQNNANGTWDVAGATLDVTDATTVRGDTLTIGQFDTVALAGGSRYVHERNTDRTYANNWELGAGTVTFDNRFSRNFTLAGDISGAGGIKAEFLGNRHMILTGDNTFTGGIEVSNASRLTVDADSVGTGDLVLSGSTATNGGILRLLGGVDLGTRDLTLNGTGGSIVNAGVNSLDGHITGSGNLQIGNAAFSGNTNVLNLDGTADYTGDTTIFIGSLGLTADNALSSESVLNIGGTSGGTSQLLLNGHDATIAGLQVTDGSSNARQISSSTAGSDLTIDVAMGESYSYAANFAGAESVNIIKAGDGTQTFNRVGGYNTAIGDVTVNDGELIWDNNTGSTIAGVVMVGVDGTLSGTGVVGGVTTVNGTLNPSGSTPGSLSFDENLTMTSMATTNLDIASLGSFDALVNDTDLANPDTITAGGILNLSTTGYAAMLGDEFIVFQNWDNYAGSFSSINGTDLGGGLVFDTTTLLTDGTLRVVSAVAVPEPSSLAFLAIVGGIAVTRRRRR